MTETWKLMAEGDKDAFLDLYKSHYQSLFSYGFSLSADRELTKDCIQELFLEIWNTRHSLNKEVSNVRSYLFTWLRRKISQELLKLKKEKSSGTSDDEPFQDSYEDLLIAFEQTEEKKAQLANALTQLTKKQLEMIRLKFFENLSYRDIAAQSALTPRTVYNLIYEAVKHLKASLKSYRPSSLEK